VVQPVGYNQALAKIKLLKRERGFFGRKNLDQFFCGGLSQKNLVGLRGFQKVCDKPPK
jgi:hypothetical protein